MPSPNLIDASSIDSKDSKSKGNRKVLRGDKAKKVLGRVTKKDDVKAQKVKASEARKKLYGKDK